MMLLEPDDDDSPTPSPQPPRRVSTIPHARADGGADAAAKLPNRGSELELGKQRWQSAATLVGLQGGQANPGGFSQALTDSRGNSGWQVPSEVVVNAVAAFWRLECDQESHAGGPLSVELATRGNYSR